MIQVSIPASAGIKEFEYNSEVELVNPVADTVATATFQGADVDWYIKAEDMILKNKKENTSTNQNPNDKTKMQENHREMIQNQSTDKKAGKEK